MAGLVGLASLSSSAEGQPGFTAGSITDTSVTLTWTQGTAGGCPATSYDVTVGSWSRDGITATTVTVTGLKPGTEYSASIIALSGCGWSDYAYTNFTTTGSLAKPTGVKATEGTRRITLGKPATPTNIQVRDVTKTSATVTWEAGTDGSCTTTRYYVRLLDGEDTSVTIKTTEVSPPEALSWTVTGLTAGTSYIFMVLPYGASCSTNWVTSISSGDFKTVTLTPPPPPGSKPSGPTNLAVSDTTNTSVTLSWMAPADSPCPIDGYTVSVEDNYEETAWERSMTPATSVSVTGLKPGTTYKVGVGSYSDQCRAYTNDYAYLTFTTTGKAPPPTPRPTPNLPTGFTVSSVTDTTAVLSWTAGADGDCATTEYHIQVALLHAGLVWEREAIPATTVTVTGLTSGASYRAYVIAYGDSCEQSATRVEVRFTTSTAPTTNTPTPEPTVVARPNAPTGFTASSITETSATLSWMAGADGGCATTDYLVTVAIPNDGSDGSAPGTTLGRTIWSNDENYVTGTTVMVTGLSRATVYFASIIAGGDSCDRYSRYVYIKFNTDGIPAKPTSVTATGGVRRATLSWTDLSDTTVTRWEYQQKTGAGSYGAWTAMSGSSATTTTYTVTGLSDATTYAFKVRAVNPAGNGGASDEVTARTAPAKPTGFTATAGAQRVILAWADPSDATITRWEYQQKQGSGAYGSWTAIPGSSATTTTYTVRGLLAETTYGYKVRAVNASGNGPASDEVTATTPQFVLVPGEETATPTPTATPTGTPTATPTPPPGATPAPGSTPTPTPPPGDAPDTGAGDTDDDVPPEPDIGAGDRDGDEPAEPDTGDGDRDDDAPAEPDTGAGGDTTDDEPDIGDTGSGLTTGAGVSLAAITGVIALALALALGGPAWARRRR